MCILSKDAIAAKTVISLLGMDTDCARRLTYKATLSRKFGTESKTGVMLLPILIDPDTKPALEDSSNDGHTLEGLKHFETMEYRPSDVETDGGRGRDVADAVPDIFRTDYQVGQFTLSVVNGYCARDKDIWSIEQDYGTPKRPTLMPIILNKGLFPDVNPCGGRWCFIVAKFPLSTKPTDFVLDCFYTKKERSPDFVPTVHELQSSYDYHVVILTDISLPLEMMRSYFVPFVPNGESFLVEDRPTSTRTYIAQDRYIQKHRGPPLDIATVINVHKELDDDASKRRRGEDEGSLDKLIVYKICLYGKRMANAMLQLSPRLE